MTDHPEKRLHWRDFIPDWKTLGKIAVYVAALYVLQVFVILPFLTYVVQSDFLASPGAFRPVNDEAGEVARSQCNRFFRQKMATKRVEFPLGGDKVWAMNDGRYLVKASAIITDDQGLARRVNYTCYVKYQGGDIFTAANWNLKGLDWLQTGESRSLR